MKKKFLTIGCVIFIFVFIFSGCKKSITGQSSDIANTFESDIKINYGGNEYECELSHTSEHVNVIKVLKPEGLSGLTFSWENGVYEVSWHDLSCEFSKQILPDNSFASSIVDVLNSIKPGESLDQCSAEGDQRTFKGKCDSGNFEISVDKDGFIKTIVIPEKDIKAELSSFSS